MKNDTQILLEVLHGALCSPPRIPNLSPEKMLQAKEIWKELVHIDMSSDKSSCSPAGEINSDGKLIRLCR